MRADFPMVMDGVAVTIECRELSCFRSAAGGFAVAVLLCAPLEFAQAQTIAPAGAPLNAQKSNVPGNAPAAAGTTPTAVSPPAGDASKPGATTPASVGPSAATSPPEAGAAGGIPAPNQSASLPAPPEEKRGFFNDLGKWWDDSVTNFNAKMKEQQAKLDEFNRKQSEAAKDATKAMKDAFTPSKVIELQERCPVAANGAPDCASAAANVCKAKGFSDGRPVDTRIAERCKASLWVSGQAPTPADCPVETTLLRVACQP
jgi:hypothetical protein